jgi:predicted nucleotidyltransferase
MADPLGQKEIAAVAAALKKAPKVQKAVLFGSRAKGSHSPGSDVDIALYGDVDAIEAESIRCELDELPFIPNRVQLALNAVRQSF